MTRRRIRTLWGSILWIAAIILMGCSRDDDLGTRTGSPVENLPAWITPLLEVGLRPDWSPDSRRLLYLDQLVGNVHEFTIETGETRSLTGHFEHHGFSRARYLASEDLLLCGPTRTSPGQEGGTRWDTQLWFLSGDATEPAQPLGERCFEGPAVSRRDLTIAWTRSTYPEELLFAQSEIWMGRIEIAEGRAQLVDRRSVVSRPDFNYLAFLETQDFRPPDENELLFTAYGYKGGEAMGVDLETGELTNYSRDWAYDEAEGVFPDGVSIAVEREVNTYTAVPSGDIDIWKLSLDGSGHSRRLTHFTNYAGYGANNPVVSPDGRKMAFSLRRKGGEHGNGEGIFLYDLGGDPGSDPR